MRPGFTVAKDCPLVWQEGGRRLLLSLGVKTLVIPDLHHRTGWVDAVVTDERPDRIVFLGDGPDARGKLGRSHSAVDRMVAFMKHWLPRPEVVWLIGNHEAHYIFNHEGIRGSGWKHWRWKRYNEALGRHWWRRMQFAHWEQGWLLSHAGFRQGLAHPILGLDPEWLAREDRQQFEAALLAPTPWTAIGDARSYHKTGAQGGVTWLDWDEEFEPIAGINQIVGHTAADEPRWKDTEDSRNLCLDTHCRHYALIVDGVVEVRAQPHPVIS